VGVALFLLLSLLPSLALASPPAQSPDALCVDGGLSGEPFAGVNCVQTVASLQEAIDQQGHTRLVVVRAFASNDENSIAGLGT
jgi:hypothetical protein